MKWQVMVLLCCGWIHGVFALGDTTNELSQKVGQGGTAAANIGNGNQTVNNNYYGISGEELAKYTKDLGVTDAALANFFKILEQNNVDRVDLDKKLREIAQNYKKWSEDAKLLENSDEPKVKELLRQAREFREGKDAQGNAIPIDFSKADELLHQAFEEKYLKIKQLQEAEEKTKAVREKAELDAARILKQRGDLKNTQLKYAEAADYYQRAAKLLPEGSEKDKGDYLNNAGLAFCHAGKYQQALPLYRDALAIREHLGRQSKDYAESLNNLAELHREQGQYEQALPRYQEALITYEQVLGKQNPYYAETRNNLALLYQSQRQYEQALPLLKDALEIRKHLGTQSKDYAESLNNLALFYYTQKKYGQALPLYEEALKIYEQVSGKQHPAYVISLNNLALFYHVQEKYEKAIPLYQEALRIYEQVLGKQHPDYVTSLTNFANLYIEQKRYEQALPLLRDALTILEQISGKQHPNYARVLNILANLCYSQGEYEKALPFSQQAAEIQAELSGEKYPKSQLFAENLRSVQDHLNGKYQVVVTQIVPGSLSSLLGIEIGDVLTHCNQQPILGKSQFTEKFAKESVRTVDELTVSRDGKSLTFQLKSSEMGVELEEKLKSEP